MSTSQANHPTEQIVPQQQHQLPLKRQLPFSSMKPPFGDYHQFSSPALDLRLKEPEAIVVKSPNLLACLVLSLELVFFGFLTGSDVIIVLGVDVSRPGETDENAVTIQAEVENLSLEERRLDEQIREMQERLRELSENENNQKWLFVTEDDIKGLPCFQNETLIAIKAPHGTTLEVPDPDEAVDYPQRRYRVVLRSTMGPVDVYLVSQFEEKFEEINNGVGASPSIPSTSGLNENTSAPLLTEESNQNEIEMQGQEEAHRTCSDINATPDFASGIMKIVPEVESDADYWLLPDADVSITDLWGTESVVEWNELGTLHDDFEMANVITPRPQTPPSSTTEVPSAANTTGR
ncbi:hypothetical protein TEA_011059 [Camellia sinensis var. sinensis]|uniref:E2F transcription factor CC-MB domain-containing protein n=1 Tax=Camellia sinensis var. sinensis TaxID=542762 RepID=A0A4S4DT24_CAMSN|nr:hypothetical protein TEA_011059 [Camellia sinensis var. sinensis]